MMIIFQHYHFLKNIATGAAYDSLFIFISASFINAYKLLSSSYSHFTLLNCFNQEREDIKEANREEQWKGEGRFYLIKIVIKVKLFGST